MNNLKLVSSENEELDIPFVEETSSVEDSTLENQELELTQEDRLAFQFNEIRDALTASAVTKAKLLGHFLIEDNIFEMSSIIEGAMISKINYYVLTKIGVTTLEDIFDEKYVERLLGAFRFTPIPTQPQPKIKGIK